MAVFTRTNGDAGGVRNVDAGASFANATIINTGIAAPLTAYKVAGIIPTGGGAGNLAAELTVGGAVETILRIVSGNASILAYQVDSNQQLSILTERSGWTDTTIQAAVRQTTAGDGSGNIGATGNTWVGAATVSSSGGIKLA
jgi:hypothetical protein